MSDKIYLGNKLESFESGETFLPVSRVILKVDGETQYVAGDESGRTIEKSCAWASQEMANSILASLKNVRYVPFAGSNALLDPAAELGDAITTAGKHGMLAEMSRQLDRQYLAEVSAPGADELDDEFPYTPRERREIDRVLGKAYSRITKTAEQILLEVSKKYATSESVSASIKVSADSINSEVSKTYLTKDAAGKTYETITNVSKISQKVESIKLSVSNGEKSSTIQLMAGSTEISSQEIKFTGDVIFASDLGADGETEIDGGRITTGKISADRIDANNLKVKAANITGTLVAGELQGDTIQLFDDDGNYAASFTINTASTADYKLDIKAEAIAITTEEPGAYVFLGNADGAYFQLAGTRAYFGAHVRPDSDGGYDLGGSSYRWRDIYAANDVIQTSDRRRKTNITYGLSRYDAFFDRLKPSAYQMVDGKRTHTGLVAQDIEQLLEECGISTMEFAGFVKSEREDGNGFDYGLRYSEFVPLIIEQVQGLKNRVKELERHGRKETP